MTYRLCKGQVTFSIFVNAKQRDKKQKKNKQTKNYPTFYGLNFYEQKTNKKKLTKEKKTQNIFLNVKMKKTQKNEVKFEP